MGRELYVYWRVPTLDSALALLAAQALQLAVNQALPAVSTRLLQRADDGAGHLTLMEIYAACPVPGSAAAQSLTALDQTTIESLALQHLALLPAPPQRHVEVFDTV